MYKIELRLALIRQEVGHDNIIEKDILVCQYHETEKTARTVFKYVKRVLRDVKEFLSGD